MASAFSNSFCKTNMAADHPARVELKQKKLPFSLSFGGPTFFCFVRPPFFSACPTGGLGLQWLGK